MAMTFSSQGCRAAAADLTKSANALDSLLNSDLTGVINKVKTQGQPCVFTLCNRANYKFNA